MSDDGRDQYDTEAQELLRSAVFRALADGKAGQQWREIGQDLRSGGATVREVGLAGVHADLFGQSARRLREHRDALDPAAAEAERRQAAEAFAALRRHLRDGNGPGEDDAANAGNSGM
ncbi:hypothetical protein [Dactylosporangium sp. CA-092794]|uniref:hypothetical protein n=1 Tax=Dactylosporangium sp. CA-092794 TaxID=3239929 RepID=UPI003D8E227B